MNAPPSGERPTHHVRLIEDRWASFRGIVQELAVILAGAWGFFVFIYQDLTGRDGTPATARTPGATYIDDRTVQTTTERLVFSFAELRDAAAGGTRGYVRFEPGTSGAVPVRLQRQRDGSTALAKSTPTPRGDEITANEQTTTVTL